MAFSVEGAGVVIEGSEASQGGGLLAADPAKLRHANDERQCGAFADAGNAEHQIEAIGEVAMEAQLADDTPHFG